MDSDPLAAAIERQAELEAAAGMAAPRRDREAGHAREASRYLRLGDWLVQPGYLPGQALRLLVPTMHCYPVPAWSTWPRAAWGIVRPNRARLITGHAHADLICLPEHRLALDNRSSVALYVRQASPVVIRWTRGKALAAEAELRERMGANLPAPRLIGHGRHDGGRYLIEALATGRRVRRRWGAARRFEHVMDLALRWQRAAGLRLLPAAELCDAPATLDSVQIHASRFGLDPAVCRALLAWGRRLMESSTPVPLALCHRDLHRGNLLEHGRTITIIDWAGAGEDIAARDGLSLAVSLGFALGRAAACVDERLETLISADAAGRRHMPVSEQWALIAMQRVAALDRSWAHAQSAEGWHRRLRQAVYRRQMRERMRTLLEVWRLSDA